MNILGTKCTILAKIVPSHRATKKREENGISEKLETLAFQICFFFRCTLIVRLMSAVFLQATTISCIFCVFFRVALRKSALIQRTIVVQQKVGQIRKANVLDSPVMPFSSLLVVAWWPRNNFGTRCLEIVHFVPKPFLNLYSLYWRFLIR